MDTQMLINLAYIAASVIFIFGIKMLGSATTARKGNRLSALGMLIAVVVTLFDRHLISYQLIIAGLIIGALIGVIAAKIVKMTSMPELVALFNGFGGLASLLVGWAEYARVSAGTQAADFVEQVGESAGVEVTLGMSGFTAAVTALAILIGGITFTGSVYAWGKLSGKLSGRPTLFNGQKAVNAVIAGLIVLCTIIFAMYPSGGLATTMVILLIVLSLALGILAVMPIGGGDMPVVISLLNSCSGLAASAAGFVIVNNVLIVAGCLVGASGLILTVIMCKAMNRTLSNVLFSGFGATVQAASGKAEGELKPISADDAYYVLEAARNVVFIPGYGMAVAQAQHAVKELGELLEANGAEVRFAIHPVAGRMPGHMNVLLAEADVPYEQLVEMDDVNPTMSTVDVAIVIGANDVVNPAAAEDPSSPIYGMPIINAHEAQTVFCLKRGKGAGFSGLENVLFLRPNARMLYGDAKASITELVTQFKDS
ncbi:NAD(P)(+) transhydrogenase (Re/Si-specific) subunit beta [Ruficoccus sp. ZRK36]|uniref:NAD(P)(+) transhydrogenase (Re/Si-specific) subunit beta n=1 Tax=Ruficoccus sp. ZRK36 TaxID=2866311 RepID=UPI001C72B2CD|nr:NAD(P)(+) transhydrogenase (Re/Si-specific) subunit beta [Ruficoccus sp. ZRK36]QYY34958.1 NAD(P)(+) transhydrogenase (Re/Si-specific) subunit beta [Ruficoccus sp. ZRK36]